MRTVTALSVSFVFLSCCQSALAQPVDCPACPASLPYGRCPVALIGHAPKDHIAFTGTVAAVKPIQCGMQIRVNVTRSSTRSLPSVIDVNVGPCLFWSGSIGDAVSGVVAEAKQAGAYSAETCTPGAVH